MRRMHSREPQWLDLANFVEDKMALVSDPLDSRDDVSILNGESGLVG